MKRIEESSASIQSTMSSFIRKASLRIINQSSIPILVKRIQQGDPEGSGQGTSFVQSIANHAQSLMKVVSKHSPIILKLHVGELIKAIHADKHPRLVEVCLQAIASISKYDPNLAPSDKCVMFCLLLNDSEFIIFLGAYLTKFLASSKVRIAAIQSLPVRYSLIPRKRTNTVQLSLK